MATALIVPVTTNLGLNLPPDGEQQWGSYINENFVTLDTAVGALQNVFQGEWESDISYAAGQTVTFSGGMYYSLTNGNINHQPDVSTTYWAGLGNILGTDNTFTGANTFTQAITFGDGLLVGGLRDDDWSFPSLVAAPDGSVMLDAAPGKDVILGGNSGNDVLFGNGTTNVAANGNLDCGATATIVDLVVLGTATVDGSPVRTFANSPDGGGTGMVWPGAGVPVSTGAAWGASIAPATLALLSANNSFTGANTFAGVLSTAGMKAAGYFQSDLSISNIRIGVGNPMGTGPNNPVLTFTNAPAPLDQKIWVMAASASQLYLSATADNGQDNGFFVVTRSGAAITDILLAGPVRMPTSLSVAGSPVRTFANSPNMTFPPAGIGVSDGSAWLASIDPASLPKMNVTNPGHFLISGILTAAGGMSVGPAIANPSTASSVISGPGAQTLIVAGTATANNRSALTFAGSFGGTAGGIYEFGTDAGLNGTKDFYIYNYSTAQMVMLCDVSDNVTFHGSVSAPAIYATHGIFTAPAGTSRVALNMTSLVAPVMNIWTGPSKGYLDSFGADTGTYGEIHLRCYNSDGGAGGAQLNVTASGVDAPIGLSVAGVPVLTAASLAGYAQLAAGNVFTASNSFTAGLSSSGGPLYVGSGTRFDLGSDAYILATSVAGRNVGYAAVLGGSGLASFDWLEVSNLNLGWSAQMRTSGSWFLLDRAISADAIEVQSGAGNPAIFHKPLSVSGGVSVAGAVLASGPSKVQLQYAGSAYLDTYGPDPATPGALVVRCLGSDGVLGPVAADFSGTGTVLLGGKLRILDRTLGMPNGSAVISADSGNLILDSAAGASLFMNYEQGTDGVHFCDGAHNTVASVDVAGLGTFNNGVDALQGVQIQGTRAPIGEGMLCLGTQGSSAYFDMYGTGEVTGDFTFRCCTATTQINVIEFVGSAIGINYNLGVQGNLIVGGDFSCTGTKVFAVPHPLDSEKMLVHACLEGPENGVFYRGEVTTALGRARVTLPDYFEGLTYLDDRSVMLTQVDDDCELAVLAASRVVGGKFDIRASVNVVTVAWEVKAVRRIGVVERLVVTRDKERR